MKRTFTNFSIEADFELPITCDNFYKHAITVRDNKDFVAGIIRKGELSYDLVNEFATGDEDTVRNAIIRVIHNRELWIHELRNVLYV
jgi:hypothetical protein